MVLKGQAVVVCGGGIAGLTAAHELAAAGARVTLLEASPALGGFAAGAQDRGVPTEHSWRGWGPFYANAFDIMRRTEGALGAPSAYAELTRPIAFAAPPSERLRPQDTLRGGWLLLRALLRRRSSGRNARTALWPRLTPSGRRFLMGALGPWIGLDPYHAPLGEVAWFAALQASGKHAFARWRVLGGPIQEAWIDPWTRQLERAGVQVRRSCRVRRLRVSGGRVRGVVVAEGELRADAVVLAVDPFAALRLARASGLADCWPELPELVAQPQVQISFRLGWRQAFRLGADALSLPESPFNLTLYSQTELWRPAWRAAAVPPGVGTLWSVTACACGEASPGQLYGLPAERLTKAQFLEECLAQLRASATLRALVRGANGRDLEAFDLVFAEPWHEWRFPEEPGGLVTTDRPKWVTDSRLAGVPRPRTRVPGVANLVCAGAHTATSVSIYSMEGAAESGKAAAAALGARPFLHRHSPAWLRVARGVPFLLGALLLLLLVVGPLAR